MAEFNPTGESLVDEAADFNPDNFSYYNNEPEPVEPTHASREQSLYGAAIVNRHIVYEAAKKPGFPFVPNEQGLVNAEPPYNAINGTPYHGPNYITLKAHAALNGFKSLEYVAENQLEKANAHAGIEGGTVKQDAKPVIISVIDDDKNAKFIKLFNIEDCRHPEAIRAYAAFRSEEREKNFNEWQQKKLVEAQKEGKTFEIRKYYPPRIKGKTEGPSVYINTADPEKYIAHCMTAAAAGRDCKVKPEVAQAFVQNLTEYLYKPSKKQEEQIEADRENGKQPEKSFGNAWNIITLGNKASQQCKPMLKDFFTPKASKNDPQQQVQRQNPTRAMQQPSLSM